MPRTTSMTMTAGQWELLGEQLEWQQVCGMLLITVGLVAIDGRLAAHLRAAWRARRDADVRDAPGSRLRASS